MNEYEPLKGYEKLYAINREGSIWSYNRNKEVKPSLNKKSKYYEVGLWRNSKSHKNYLYHRLLALQFLPNPNSLPCIDHINKNKLDNSLENLRWVTHRQNNNNRTSNNEHRYITETFYGYVVSFNVNRKQTYFGSYETLDEALSERDCQLDLHGLENLCYVD